METTKRTKVLNRKSEVELNLVLRGWEGKLTRINKLLSKARDRGVFNKTDIAKYDALIRRYYRLHNDGDIPRTKEVKNAIKFYYNEGIRYTDYQVSSVILENELTETFSYLLEKYRTQLNKLRVA